MDPRLQKLVNTLYSRKFWAIVLSVLAGCGIVQASELEALYAAYAPYVQAGIVLAGGLGLVFGIALEDSLKAIANAIAVAVAEAKREE